MKILLFFLISTNLLISQTVINYNLSVDYKIICNTERKTTLSGTLKVDESLLKSIFIYGNNKNESITKKEDDDATLVINLSGIEKANYLSFVTDSILTKDKIHDTFVLEEKLPLLKWELLSDEKVLNNLRLNKAKLSFRGRNYTAWYTLDYPIPFGPWKFNSLPGLIIEIYDETNRYHWIATSIKRTDLGSLDVNKMFRKIEKINLKEYVDRRYNNKSKFINPARLPRGAVVTSNNIPRNGFEIKFEWEDEVKKD